ncbi:MAG TPA: TIGR03118 family protein, partial [Ferruginibacter sp.]|nr:TIGR03118 family protein [Ferruginibacter sp.]
MKRFRFYHTPVVLIILMFLTATYSCKKSDEVKQSFTVNNLVASKASYGATRVDANLVNGWGIAFSPSGNAWISAEDAGVSVVYDKTGAQVLAPVSIPSPTASNGGSPSGQVYNSTTDFLLLNGNPAKFIFAGTDGVISAWNTGSAAERKVNRSATSAYTGLANGANGANNYIYAADFKSKKI